MRPVQTHCKNGHEYGPMDVRPKGHSCMQCQLDAKRERVAMAVADREAAGLPPPRKGRKPGNRKLVEGGLCARGHTMSGKNVRFQNRNGLRYAKCAECDREDQRRRNKSRGCGPAGKDRTHCTNGHEFTAENTLFTKRGTRYCKICRRAHTKAWHGTVTPEELMWTNAKNRANRDGIPFDIAVTDIVIPSTCPLLGMKLVVNKGRGPADSSPTLDKVIPELGYVLGNICVMSWRANRLKSDATVEESEKITNWLKAFHAKKLDRQADPQLLSTTLTSLLQKRQQRLGS